MANSSTYLRSFRNYLGTYNVCVGTVPISLVWLTIHTRVFLQVLRSVGCVFSVQHKASLGTAITVQYMRGIVALLPAKNSFKQISPVKRSWGILATSTPKKQAHNDSGTETDTKEKIDPVVTFSRPPQLPPVLGPLVALSLYETWSNHDTYNDGS